MGVSTYLAMTCIQQLVSLRAVLVVIYAASLTVLGHVSDCIFFATHCFMICAESENKANVNVFPFIPKQMLALAVLPWLSSQSVLRNQS